MHSARQKSARLKSTKLQSAPRYLSLKTSSRSLSAAAVQYQRVALENDFASKQLAAALASLEEARSETQRKQAYVERIVQPNLPDDPLEPRRLRGIVATFVLGLVAFAILRMLLAGVKEHAQ